MTRKPIPWLGYYKLQGKLAVPCQDAVEWAMWFETATRRVKETQIGRVWVSTIFLGLDHNFACVFGDPLGGEADHLPHLFETMAFDGRSEDKLGPELYCNRCGTWEEAEAQHEEACAFIRQRIKEKVNE